MTLCKSDRSRQVIVDLQKMIGYIKNSPRMIGGGHVDAQIALSKGGRRLGSHSRVYEESPV